MADAFRGLTIRLGADARPLNSAINSIRSSASQAQKQLTSMNKALKFDRTNVSALNASLDLVQDKAKLTARAAENIRLAMSQVDPEIKKMASDMKLVYSNTQKARSEYVSVDAELQQIYDHAAKVVKKMSGLSETDAVNYVKLLREQVRGTGEAAEKARAELRGLISKAAGSESLSKMFNLAKGDAEGLLGVYDKLKAKHKELDAVLGRAKDAEGYKAMETQLIAFEAELRQAAVEATRLNVELYELGAGEGIGKALSKIDRIDAAIDDAAASARKMNEVFKSAPGSLAAAEAKMRAAANQEELMRDRAEQLKTILRSMQDTGIDKMANSVRNVHKWFSEASHKASELKAQVDGAEAYLKSLNLQMNKMKESGVDEASDDFNELKGKIKDAEVRLGNLNGKLVAANIELKKATESRAYVRHAEDLRVLQSELDKTTKKATALRRALDFSKTIRTMGYGLYSTITPAIMIAGRYAIQSARDIDAAYRDMRKTVNGTEEEFEHLLDSALKFSTTHFTTAEQMLEIESIGGQLGIAATDLEAFGETVANLDIATNIDAETVAEQLGKMGSVLNVTEDQYDNFGDALVRLGNNMPVMESDIMTLSTRFMGMGKVVGMDAAQILGWAAAASATGQKAEAAGSAMQRFISKMETAVVGGGEVLEKWAAVADMSAQEFADAFNKDASSAMKAFVDGLGRIQKEGGSVNQVLQDLKINNVRDKQLLEGLAMQAYNAGDGMSLLGYALQLSTDAWNGFATETKDGSIEYAGDAAREAGKKAEGFSGQVQQMINTAQLLSTELAKGALPYVIALKNAFQSMTDAISAMPDSMKTAIVGALGAVAALGPLAVSIGAVGAAIDTLMEAFTAATAARTLARVASGAGMLEKGLAQIETIAPKAADRLETFILTAMDAAPAFVAMVPAIAAAAAVIAFLVTDISKAAKNAENFNKSVDGYSDAIAKSIPQFGVSAEGFESLATSVKHAQVNLDSLAKSQAEARESIIERNRATQEELAELSSAKATIGMYLNKELDASQAAQFRAAVERVNEACGTQYQVVNAAAGAIRDEKGALLETTAAIDEYISKKMIEIQQQALSADYADAHAAERESYKAMVSQLATYNDLKEKSRNADSQADKDYYDGLANEAYDYYEKLHAMHSEAQAGEEAIAKSMEAAQESANGGAKSIDALIYSTDKWMDSFKAIYGDDAWASSLDGFVSALNEVGAKQEDLANLTPEQIAKVVDAYSRTNDIKAALEEVGISVMGLEEKVRAGFEAAGQDFGYFVEQLGGNAAEIAQKFNDAGGAAAMFANVTEEQIATALAESEGSVDAFIAKLQEFGQQNVEATVKAEGAEEAAAEMGEAASAAQEADGTTATMYAEEEGTEETQEQFDNVQETVDETDGDSATVYAYISGADGVNSAINTIRENLRSLDGDSATVTVYKQEGNAAGGFYRLHANGGFITNGPTALGRDRYGTLHIAGEEGREWIKRHADGTTSIVPIENRRYLKPYAREIAGMIGGTGTTNYYITLDYKAGDDANKIVRDLGFALRTSAMMEG